MPNHVRAWKTSFYHKINGHNIVLSVADDYELLIRTFLEGNIMKIPIMCYVQHINNHENMSFIRNKEIHKIQSWIYIYYKEKISEHFQKMNIDDKLHMLSYSYENFDLFDNYSNLIYYKNIISIIIILDDHNSAYLDDIIENIFRQNMRDYEMIIIFETRLEYKIEKYKNFQIKWWNFEISYCDNYLLFINYALKFMTCGKYVIYVENKINWNSDHLSKILNILQSDISFCIFCDNINKYECTQIKNISNISFNSIAHKYTLIEKYGHWKNLTDEISKNIIDKLIVWVDNKEKYLYV